MAALFLGARFAADPHVEYRSVETGALLVNVSSGACFRLNDVGADLWTDLTAGLPLEKAIDTLSARYDAEPEVIATEALSLCRQLTAAGLIRQLGDGADTPDKVP